MATAVFSIAKLGRHVGAEITGIDLSQPLDDATFAGVSDAFFENQVPLLATSQDRCSLFQERVQPDCMSAM